MDLKNNAPREFLAGWIKIHHVMRESSLEGGPRIVGSDYLGKIQRRRLAEMLDKTDENGASGFRKVIRLRPLIFTNEI